MRLKGLTENSGEGAIGEALLEAFIVTWVDSSVSDFGIPIKGQAVVVKKFLCLPTSPSCCPAMFTSACTNSLNPN